MHLMSRQMYTALALQEPPCRHARLKGKALAAAVLVCAEKAAEAIEWHETIDRLYLVRPFVFKQVAGQRSERGTC